MELVAFLLLPVLVIAALLWTRRRGNPGSGQSDDQANRNLGADGGPPMTNPLGGGTHGGSGFGP